MAETTTIDASALTASSAVKQFIDRIMRLEEEKKGIGEDIKEVYAEAKGTGLDAKILRRAVSLLKKEKQEREEEAELVQIYLAAYEGNAPTP